MYAHDRVAVAGLAYEGPDVTRRELPAGGTVAFDDLGAGHTLRLETA